MKYGSKRQLFTFAIFSSEYDIKPTFEQKLFFVKGSVILKTGVTTVRSTINKVRKREHCKTVYCIGQIADQFIYSQLLRKFQVMLIGNNWTFRKLVLSLYTFY